MSGVDGRTVRSAQRRKPNRNGFGATKRKAFLQELAATCNVTRAARAASVSTSTAYGLRLRDGEFAQLWAVALETGYVRLETALLERAIGARQPDNPTLDDVVGEGAPAEAEGPAETLDVDLAIKLLARHRDADRRAPRQGGRPVRQPTPDEIYKALERKLTAIERRLERGR